MSNEKEYDVKKIHSFNTKKRKYRVEWENYKKRTWEPKENIENTDAYKEFISNKKYDVKKIHDHKVENNVTYYKVEWKNYKEFTWEPEENLTNSKRILQNYISNKENIVPSSKKRKLNSDKKYTELPITTIKVITRKQSDRQRIYNSQGGRCNCCGQDLKEYEVDHKRPLKHGGLNDITNLHALCPPCHKFKTLYLDDNIIARYIQANNGVNIDIDEMWTTCQTYYYKRNYNLAPRHIFDMFEFMSTFQPIFKQTIQNEINENLLKQVLQQEVFVPLIEKIVENKVEEYARNRVEEIVTNKFKEMNDKVIINIKKRWISALKKNN